MLTRISFLIYLFFAFIYDCIKAVVESIGLNINDKSVWTYDQIKDANGQTLNKWKKGEPRVLSTCEPERRNNG